MCGNNRIIRTEQKHALVDDHTSFKMRRMATRTDHLFHIAEATGSKMYTRESKAEVQGPAKALVLSLKQVHAHYYRLYEKGTTRAMVGLQGLHSSDAFWHSNVLIGVGLKSFCLWCFKFGGNTKTITTHLREVHYRLAIVCDVCQSFTSMSVQVVLEHQSAGKSHTRSLRWRSGK